MIVEALTRLTQVALRGAPHREMKSGPRYHWIRFLRRFPGYYETLWRTRPRVAEHRLVQVHLEPTNLCNLRCVGCTNPRQTAPTGMMPLAHAREVIDQALAAVGPTCILGFYIRGESTLHPELAEMIRYARDRGFRRLLLSSNVARIREEQAEAVFAAGLSELRLSIDGADAATFERIRLGASFAQVEENVAMLDRVRRRLGADVFFRLHAALDAAGFRTIPRIYRKFHHVVQRFVFTALVNQGGLFAQPDARSLSRMRFAVSTRFQLPCRLLFDYAGVTWDGKVTSCCVDYSDHFVVGRLEDGIAAAFGGQGADQLREAHLRGDLDPLCARCGFSNALVDWFEDEVNLHVEKHGVDLGDPRRDARFERFLDLAVSKFDALADAAEARARSDAPRKEEAGGCSS